MSGIWNVEINDTSQKTGKAPTSPHKTIDVAKWTAKKKNAASDLWDLEHIDLVNACADFYLLMYLEIYQADEGKFTDHVTRLDELFSSYTDMAIGGELRHAKKKGAKTIPPMIRKALAGGILPTSRKSAWMGWYALRSRWGLKALEWCVETYSKPWAAGHYGGPKWGKIADTLRRRETGEYSPRMFVDICWGLEHNGGTYFGKYWADITFGHTLPAVLDAGRNVTDANMADSTLLPYASADVATLWAAHRSEIM